MDIESMPIINGLYKYMNYDRIQFHMPGHKGNINEFEELNFIRENLYKIDKTEVPGLDNLHLAEGIIQEAQIKAALAYGAYQSYFLVNGSTCGIYSMIMGATKPGDRILVQRNCHRAVFMAVLLGRLEAVYVDPEIVEGFNIPGGVTVENIKIAIGRHRDLKAIVLTNPSYYGVCSNLRDIIKEAHLNNIYVLVDEAHGAHLPFNSQLPASAIECGADAAVVSIHKSLPALTQASLLNVSKALSGSCSGIEFMLRIFQTTSPSYVLMASIDAARQIMVTRGEKLLNELILEIEVFKYKIKELKSVRLLNNEIVGLYGIENMDITKLVINSSLGGRELDNILRDEYGIQVEMSDINNVVLITSIGDNKHSLEMLYKALYSIDLTSKAIENRRSIAVSNKYITAMNIGEAYYSNKNKVLLSASVGKISGEMVVPYPPGIPILLPGELITQDILDNIELLKTKRIPINGTEDSELNLIWVLDSKENNTEKDGI